VRVSGFLIVANETLAGAYAAGYAARMDRQRLLATLQQLRAELANEEDVDTETLARLDQLTSDLQRNVNREGEKAARQVEPDSSGLKEMLLKFEADHPQLSASVGRVADALAAMGF
jgi:hypothetical protein